MGVPKFFNWVKERYPYILSDAISSSGDEVPEFDNLYLDMNGIIHCCTHGSDQLSRTPSMEVIVKKIFRYLERVMGIIKPKKLLYVAVDGVAPRAKLNQQRSRRFRTAYDRITAVNCAIAKGENVENVFDSNCISPGTPLMEEISKHLSWFIRKKVKEDPVWRCVTVYYSGHNVPGEGEHKLISFIRDMRNLPSYEPNQRHCINGNDADMIMLSLSTHEPYFHVLREILTYDVPQPLEPGLHFVRINILRQYIVNELSEGSYFIATAEDEVLDSDFGDIGGHPLDDERLIDDFVFLTFL